MSRMESPEDNYERVSARLSGSRLEAFNQLVDDEGLSKSEVIRRGIDAVADSDPDSDETPALDRHLVGFGRSREFEREDSPGPGIRKRVALKRATRDGVPLAQHEADNDMVERFDALVDVVLEGGVGA